MLSTQEGGAETFFEKLAFGFDARGIAQHLVIEPFPTREKRLAPLENATVGPIRFGGVARFGAGRRLQAAIGRFQPDVILTWMNRASRRVPAGVTCPVVGRLGGYYPLRHYQRCTHLVGITPDLVEHLTRNGWPADRAALIPNFGETPDGVGDAGEARRRLRAELGVPEAVPLLVALGRLHEVKAHDTLLRALTGVPGDAHLMIAGEGPLESELRGLSASLGLTNRVHFLGWRRDTQNLYAAADLCVFPSRYEPNGTVVMESWAHGVPLIASAAKGPAWLIDDGQTGLLFPIDDEAALARGIEGLIVSADLRERLVTQGREAFESRFTRDQVVDQYLDLFRSL